MLLSSDTILDLKYAGHISTTKEPECPHDASDKRVLLARGWFVLVRTLIYFIAATYHLPTFPSVSANGAHGSFAWRPLSKKLLKDV
jgi:hypothetical protein